MGEKGGVGLWNGAPMGQKMAYERRNRAVSGQTFGLDFIGIPAGQLLYTVLLPKIYCNYIF